MSTPAPLVTVAWWRAFAERLARSAAQTSAPILAAVVAAGGHITLTAVAVAVAGNDAAPPLTTIVRTVADVRVDSAAAWWVQLIDRGLPAAAAVIAAIPLASWADVAAVDWANTGKAALAAAFLALLSYYAAPPAFTHRASFTVGRH